MSTVALERGQWVHHRGVWRWQAEPDAPRAICGTDRGYHRHRSEGESTCDSCRAAHAAAQREWKART